ncbi:hypothetical protein RB195_012901 [Necator americanus]
MPLVTLALLLLSSVITVLHLLGCGSKDKPRQAAGKPPGGPMAPRHDAGSKSAQAAEKDQGNNAAGTPGAKSTMTKSKMGDDGGYESCPDMTPSELARAAKVGGGAK